MYRKNFGEPVHIPGTRPLSELARSADMFSSALLILAETEEGFNANAACLSFRLSDELHLRVEFRVLKISLYFRLS